MKFIGMIDALVSQIVPLHSYRTGSVANAPTDVPARTIMGILGHSQISLTLNTYSHLSQALEQSAADALDRMLQTNEESA